MSGKSKTSSPNTGSGASESCNATIQPCPLGPAKEEEQEEKSEYAYDMAELVEIIKQDKEKWVKGAAMETSEIAGSVDRSDKDGSDYKQYINLKQDIEGKAKRHPENGRRIVFKARIKQTSGEKKLENVFVKFSYKKTDGPNKINPGGTEPDVWISSDLTGNQKEGLKVPNGALTVVVKTDEKGWTAPVYFFLSEYGGDKFKISAELHPKMPGASGAKKVETGSQYVVWRKFWYQLTYADGFAAKDPTKAVDAYKELFAEMIKSGEKKFVKGDLPADLQKRTFYKEFMLKHNGGNAEVATVGGNNKWEFSKKPIYDKDTPKDHPFKSNLIVCNYQCDPDKTTATGIFKLNGNGQEITLAKGSGGSVVCKPALKAGADLIVRGEWSKTKTPWAKKGNIRDGSIEIVSSRSNTLSLKVDLSGSTTGSPPIPTATKPIYIKLKVESATGYLGESYGKGQILCVYRPGTAAGKQGSEEDYNDTVAHELGHMWNQTPRPTKQPASLYNHPSQYVGHGGSGSHCSHGIERYEHSATYSREVEPKTKITKAAATASNTHEVKSSKNFNKGYTVKVDGTERVIKTIVDATHIKFTTSFTAKLNDSVRQTVDWNNRHQKWPSPNNGDCIMYHSYSSKCSHKFCVTCKPYLQLQDMSSF